MRERVLHRILQLPQECLRLVAWCEAILARFHSGRIEGSIFNEPFWSVVADPGRVGRGAVHDADNNSLTFTPIAANAASYRYSVAAQGYDAATAANDGL